LTRAFSYIAAPGAKLLHCPGRDKTLSVIA
jgi:hypothetical protein